MQKLKQKDQEELFLSGTNCSPIMNKVNCISLFKTIMSITDQYCSSIRRVPTFFFFFWGGNYPLYQPPLGLLKKQFHHACNSISTVRFLKEQFWLVCRLNFLVQAIVLWCENIFAGLGRRTWFRYQNGVYYRISHAAPYSSF